MKKVLTLAISGKKGHGKDTFGGYLLNHAQDLGWNVVRKSLADPLKEEAAQALAIFESTQNNSGARFGAYLEHTERIEQDFDENSNQWESVIYWFANTYDVELVDAVIGMKQICSAALGSFENPGAYEGYNEYDHDTYENILAEFHHPVDKLAWRVFLQWWGTEFRRRLCGDDYWRKQLIAFNQSLPDKTIHGVFDVRFPDEFDMVRNDLTNGFLIRVNRPDAPDPGPDGNHPSETALDDIAMEKWNAVVTNNVSLEQLDEGAEICLLNALMWARLV